MRVTETNEPRPTAKTSAPGRAGLANKEIAVRLGIGGGTVKAVSNVLAKLGMQSGPRRRSTLSALDW
jgi:hypothetical protein